MAFDPKNPQRTPAYNFEKPQEQKKSKSALMEEEIYIKIKPKIIVKTLSFVVLFLFVFYLGRWSIDTPSFGLNLFSGDHPVTGAVTTTEKVVTESKITKVETPKTTTPAPKVEEKATSNVLTTTAASVVEVPKTTTTEPNTSTTETAATDEVFLASYNGKVAVALTNMKVDWKGDDWGKISQITYTIKNNEDGAVKADHFILTVEGYDDKALQKKIPIPISSQKLSAGKSYSQTLNVPSGFTFAESTTGSLGNVRIGLLLYDANDKMMSSMSREFDLKAYK